MNVKSYFILKKDGKAHKQISCLPLLERWEKFLAEGESSSIEDFAIWTLKRDTAVSGASVLNDLELQVHFDGNSSKFEFAYLNPEASFLIWKLYKFLRFYTKGLFREVGFSNHDEFAILAHIDYKKECTKKVAIEENMIDLTTGTDILKRLVRKGLVAEKVNSNDRREKMLRLTDKGRKTLQETYMGFAQTPDLLAGMNKSERELLVSALQDLDNFHSQNYNSGDAIKSAR